jgi:hypothetical protein
MNRLQQANWIPGAVVRVFSKRRGVWHFGVTGTSWGTVYHASKDRGLFLLTTYEEFAEGQPTEYTMLPDTFEMQRAILLRADSQVGKPFRLLNANCEDFVNWIVTGVARSPQREQLALAALIVVILGGLGGLGGFGRSVSR